MAEQIEQDNQDDVSRLEQLKAQATQQYSLKNYNAAAEFYSEAAEVQDEINGEMSPANADLLYQYGRCLFHVAVSNSDVLGGKVVGEEPKRKKRKVAKGESSSNGAAVEQNGEGSLISGAMKDGEVKGDVGIGGKEKETINKPFFEITGDENWTDSDESDVDGDEDGGAEDEAEDDFAIAYEILDVARVLLARKLSNALEMSERDKGKGKETDDTRQIKERLADTHDLQAEISLENERFHDAINDARESLRYKLELYPQESSLVAEAHFKLSLALEFASVTTAPEAAGTTGTEAGGSAGNAPPEQQQIDTALRDQAAEEMEKAIASCRLRITREEELFTSSQQGTPEAKAKQESIADVKGMLQDLNNRLVDLRNPAVSLSAGGAGADDPLLKGVLGAMLGQSKGEQQRKLQEATAGANDLSGLVKKKKNKPEEIASANGINLEGIVRADSKGKRKAESEDMLDSVSNGSKKAKVDE